MPQLELQDIQGVIISGYDHLPHSAHLILRFDDPQQSRRWLSELADRVTTSYWVGPDGKKKKPSVAVNVALTAFGLKKLGLSEAAVRTFPQEFQDGIAKPPRPRRMGDTGASAPDLWQFGGTPSPAAEEIHALLILQAPRGETGDENAHLHALCETEKQQLDRYNIREVVPRHMTCQDRDSREHFGFRDAISQPLIEGSPNRRQGDYTVKAGEFILGYDNEYDLRPHSPMVRESEDRLGLLSVCREQPSFGPAKDLGRNGSYLVLRKLQQDVAAFRRFLKEYGNDEIPPTKLGAKLVGRWPNGAPLALADKDDPQLSTENNFGYAEQDADGLRCPMSAHVRRANPRDGLIGSPEESRRVTNRHRIVRRGVLFGSRLAEGALEDDGVERGILFICINTDIERQFEFLQQTWINSPKFGAHYSDSDPIMGTNRDPSNPRDAGPWTMTIPAERVRRRLVDIPRFVTMRGGAYFFLPSIRALRYLGSIQPS